MWAANMDASLKRQDERLQKLEAEDLEAEATFGEDLKGFISSLRDLTHGVETRVEKLEEEYPKLTGAMSRCQGRLDTLEDEMTDIRAWNVGGRANGMEASLKRHHTDLGVLLKHRDSVIQRLDNLEEQLDTCPLTVSRRDLTELAKDIVHKLRTGKPLED